MLSAEPVYIVGSPGSLWGPSQESLSQPCRNLDLILTPRSSLRCRTLSFQQGILLIVGGIDG